MFCTDCGEPEQNGNFCRKCGHKLRNVSQKTSSIGSVHTKTDNEKESISDLYNPYSAISPVKTKMGFGNSIATCFKKYAVFRGRASRAEYWFWQLFWVLVFVGCIFLSSLADSSIGGTLFGLFIIGTYLPSLAVLVRRLHDTGKSGWWVLINGVPFIGWIVILIFTLQYSEDFDNEFGDRTH